MSESLFDQLIGLQFPEDVMIALIKEQEQERELDRRAQEAAERWEAFKRNIHLNKVHQPEYQI